MEELREFSWQLGYACSAQSNEESPEKTQVRFANLGHLILILTERP